QASSHQPFLAKLLADTRPFVLAFKKVLPVALCLSPRNQLVQWSNVENNAIVKIRHEMEVRSPSQFVLKIAQFGQQISLTLNVFGDPLRLLARLANICGLPLHCVEASFFQANLWLDMIDQCLEQRVLVGARVVQ